ncbi:MULTISPECIES: monovalent cation/H(+) antiporter subunit G [Micromonospora]|uniref:Cation:proton antiporter n=1 Tax=Micromonospora solifontis TaxID=2487138 RepID=A0ABX9WAL1_9ACTN|nr:MULTISPECIES: monovalent cation/H(+) antiporter subunit G [Micromonospora]NES12812.1 monovalent cation/H(+) antiporter subunit G [Micromonospora sp. PPF5-17B]NES38918.1 monovalent cation/H(+) antiporter subunit G [Micromonospora solifontis]NES54737.1 monovalent cation/H(+) antiporter subunit G [Micromonospora sp. PPF5-6]RNL92579.1 cation:proton antiporter [Micromonospora solifontis]
MIRVPLASVLLVVGTGLVVVSAVGLVRLPDAYNRMNALAKAASLGAVGVLLGVLLLLPSPRNAVVLLLATGLQLFTAPLGGYALARAAYRAGTPLSPATWQDELAARGAPPASATGGAPDA